MHPRHPLRTTTLVVAALLVAGIALMGVSLRSPGASAATEPLWVNDLAYGSIGGGFYWDPVSNQVWTGQRGWHLFAPQPPRTVSPLWVNQLDYGSRGGGFYLDPLAGQVWTAERGWHLYSPPPATGGAPAGLVQCRVSGITDGDTITVDGCSDAGSIRLLLIDTPETSGDCYAAESTAYIRSRILGTTVGLERDATDTDQYGRRLRYVWVGGELLNETMVRDGYAKLLVFENVKYRSRIAAAEADARANLRGLWGACGSGACTGPIRISALDKVGEVVTISGSGSMAGWRLVSERGAATQRYDFPAGVTLNGSLQVVSGVPAFTNTAARLWWNSETVWNNSDDDDALLYDASGKLVCEFDDGMASPSTTAVPTTAATATPTPVATATTTPSGNCHPSYPTVCIPPPPPDLDCGDIPYRRFTVIGSDPHRFDGDNDGIGCES